MQCLVFFFVCDRVYILTMIKRQVQCQKSEADRSQKAKTQKRVLNIGGIILVWVIQTKSETKCKKKGKKLKRQSQRTAPDKTSPRTAEERGSKPKIQKEKKGGKQSKYFNKNRNERY